MNDRVKNVLNTIIDKFKSGDIPEAVALATFPIPDTPSANWSFTNRTLMFISGTGDARGFRQWKKVNRWVKKGATAIYILTPCFTKKAEESDEDEREVISYFKPTPVFRFEDTEGDALDHENVKLPNFPLVETAESWGISKRVKIRYRKLLRNYQLRHFAVWWENARKKLLVTLMRTSNDTQRK